LSNVLPVCVVVFDAETFPSALCSVCPLPMIALRRPSWTLVTSLGLETSSCAYAVPALAHSRGLASGDGQDDSPKTCDGKSPRYRTFWSSFRVSSQ
jgi:hypothetical protein